MKHYMNSLNLGDNNKKLPQETSLEILARVSQRRIPSQHGHNLSTLQLVTQPRPKTYKLLFQLL